MIRTRRAVQTLSLLGCILLCGCRSVQKAPPGEATDAQAKGQQVADQVTLATEAQTEQHITVAPVETGTSVSPYRAKGRIALPDNATWRVGVLAEGRVERVNANLGDYVKQGQVLALMHSHDVHEARAAYANAVAERTRLQAAEALAQKNYERSQRLYGLKAESVMQVEMAKQEFVNAQSATSEADNNVTRERTHLEDILGVSADIQVHGPGDSDFVPVVAPANGRILQKNVTPGATISPSTDAFVIGDLSRLWMLASVDAEVLSQLHTGQHATVSVADVPSATYSGVIENLGQEFDPTTHLIQVRIVITHPDRRLRPEMLANAEFSVGSGTPTLLVPQEAVQQVNGQDVVFVQIAPDRYRVQAVKLGEIVDGKVRVQQGLNAGEKVITHGSFVAKSELLKATIGD
jgi:cobalt-zinc-cadmium efflux system membrane fusion protein